MNDNRRGFLKKATFAALAVSGINQMVSGAFAAGRGKKIKLHPNDIVVFQGDSITDANRDRKQLTANIGVALGSGYSLMAGSALLNNHPELSLQIFNRGVGGDKVYQLIDRWENDTINLKPDVLSILIGVNDHWSVVKHHYTGTIETYRDDYKKLLERTKSVLPDVKILIGEPFGVKGVKAVDDSWYPKFDEFRTVARELAQQYDAGFIPYQSVFDQAQKAAPGAYWTLDGVHPTAAGAQLMAQAWLAAVK